MPSAAPGCGGAGSGTTPRATRAHRRGAPRRGSRCPARAPPRRRGRSGGRSRRRCGRGGRAPSPRRAGRSPPTRSPTPGRRAAGEDRGGGPGSPGRAAACRPGWPTAAGSARTPHAGAGRLRAMEFVLIAIAILLVGLVLGVSLLVGRGRRTTRLDDDAATGTTLTRPRPPTTEAPPRPSGATASGMGTTAEPDAVSPEAPPEVELPPAAPEPGLVFETPPPSAGRLVRLRSRLARSQSNLGRGLLTVLARERPTEDDWEEVEETLLAADVGVAATQQVVQRLRTQSMVLATATGADLRQLLVRELVAVLGPDMDRRLGSDRHDGLPGVVLVVGVNGAGKTTTVGKIARVLVGDGKSVVLGAADTFRAAAADQLETWGERVGVLTVRGRE